jgi:putative transposase
VKYAFVRKHVVRWSVVRMCAVLGVSRAGYYAWIKRPVGRRVAADRELFLKVVAIHQESRKTYGSPRIHAELVSQGFRHGCKRIARVMRENGLRGKKRGHFKVTTTDSNHTFPASPNLLERTFAPHSHKLNQVWVGDITYIPTSEGFLYLATVLDLRSREVVGWAMHPTRDTALVIEALQLAIARRQPAADLVFHSDRGVQYASGDFRKFLRANSITQSMSRKGNCWDNAVAESFFSTLKTELAGATRYPTRAVARGAIFEYIVTWYNRKRRHSALGYQTPAQAASGELAA